MVRILRLEGPEPEQIALDHTVADIPASDKALLDFAVKLNNRPTEVNRSDIESLRRHGFSEVHIQETVLMVGFTKFANYVAFGLGTVPDFDSSRIVRELGLKPEASEKPKKDLNPPVPDFTLMKDEASASSVVDEDSELVERTRHGDLDAFDDLVRRHQHRIYRTLMAITRKNDEAEDGVQNVFLRAFQHIGGFQGASKFATWLTRIAINEGSERLRMRKNLVSLDDPNAGDDALFRPRNVAEWGNPEQLYSQAELRSRVEQELLKLPAKYRVPVMLRDLQELTTEETAEILGIGVPALKSRLLRGRMMLREALAPSMGRKTAHV
jgi:RNA polymerase sigma-70 factor (ECF subfamily)